MNTRHFATTLLTAGFRLALGFVAGGVVGPAVAFIVAKVVRNG